MVEDADAYLKGISALVAAVFAFVVLSGKPRRVPNVYLGAFLGLIALNQFAETVGKLVEDPARTLSWGRVAAIAASLDPAVLLGFAGSYRPESRLARGMPQVVAWTVGGTLALWVGWPVIPGGGTLPILLVAYTFVTYGLVLIWTIQHYRAEQQGAWRWLVPAMSIVAIPVLARLVETVNNVFGPQYNPNGRPVEVELISVMILVVGLFIMGVWLWDRRLEPRVGQGARLVGGSLVLGGLLTLFLQAARIESIVTVARGLELANHTAIVGHAGAPFRWLAFGALASIATLREDALGFTLATRRRTARILIGLSILVIASVILAVGAGLDRVPSWMLIALALVLVVSHGFRSIVDRIAYRAYNVPTTGGLAERHETYRLAVERALSVGRDPVGDMTLTQLRDELDIEPSAARLLEQIADAASSDPIAPGRLLARRYRIERPLGRGSTGRILLARDELLDRKVAAKEVFIEGEDTDVELLHEARLAGAIRHPNVVQVFDLVPRKGSTLLIEEYVDGGTLEDRIRHGKLDAETGIHLLTSLLEGLAHVHRQGIVHRDLKPANVLLTKDGEPKIVDFGIATLRSTRTANYGTRIPIAGTRGFMAPEQCEGETPTPACDIYAVGRIIDVMIVAPLPPALAAIRDKALAHEAADRWPDATAMLVAVRTMRGRIGIGHSDAHQTKM